MIKHNLENITEITPVSVIDATCSPTPLPILSLKKNLASCRAEDVIEIKVKDNTVCKDIESFCNTTKNSYIGKKMEGIYISCFVKKI